ncbi:MAG: ABC transporter ATP-binding protein, partial [Clostridiales bacterium]
FTNIIYGRINAYVTSNIIYDIKTLLFKSMQKLSINFYLNKQTGNLMTRVSGDTDNIQEFFHDGIPELFTNVVIIIIVVITMFIQNTLLTIISLSTTPILLIVSLKIFPIIKKKYTSMYISRSLLNSLVNDVLMGFRVVKAFGKEKEEIGRFSKSSSYVKKLEYNLAKFTNLIFQSMNILMISSSIIIWGFGGWQVINGQMEFGMLITFTGYVALINRPLIYMVQTTNWWSNAMNSAGRIFEILDSLPDVIEKKNPIVKRKFDGLIEFKNINFSYEANKNILHNINMIIEPGEVIGIVGRSGAGKSTIANLLMRMYDTTKGEIRIDGVNIKNYAFKCLNKNIGMVMQDVYLFTGSIYENIAYAKPSSSMEEIINAAKAAFAHDFILKLPYGYDTVIGKNAQSLSGGEKQRLSIARTILHNPKILILDEATSSVDTKTEKQIQKAIDILVSGRTVISIAHRLSTLNNADRIFVIEKGRIIEFGTHRELMGIKGEFYEMYIKQKKALELGGVIYT